MFVTILLFVAGTGGASSLVSPVPTASVPADVEGLGDRGDPLDIDGDRVAVTNGSSVAIHERTNDGWVQIASLEAPSGASDTFGTAIALDADVLAVGEPWFGDDRGRVHVYEPVAGSWQLVETLTPDDAERAYLGVVVELDDGHLVAEAYWDDSSPDIGVGGHGNAYVWERTAEGWTRDVKIGTAHFEPIVFQDGTLIATDFGTVYEEQENGSWAATAELPELPQGPGSVYEAALNLPRLAVAYDDVYLPSYPPDGEVAIYERDAEGDWNVVHHHETYPGAADVALGEDTLIVTGAGDQVFHRVPDGSWRPTGTLTDGTPSLGGEAVLSGDKAAMVSGGGDELDLYPRVDRPALDG